MDDRRLTQLGREVAEHMGDGPDPATLEKQRAAIVFADYDTPSSSSRAPRATFAFAAAAAAALALGAGLWAAWPGADGRAAVDPTPRIAERDAPEAQEDAPPNPRTRLAIDTRDGAAVRHGYTDESNIVFASNSVAELDEDLGAAVNVTLDEGELSADITSGQERVWSFVAGQFTATVVGTEFEIMWRDGLYTLGVDEGHVRVEGKDFAQDGVSVRAGQLLTIDTQAGSLSIEKLEARPMDFELLEEDPELGVLEVTEPAENRATTRRKLAKRRAQRRKKARPATWSQLARRGEHEAAWDKAGTANDREALLTTLGARDLLILADVARLNGERAFAQRTLETLRARHPDAKASADAAFRLGLLAGTSPKALRWFSRYLDEAPNGPLSSDARGRIMEQHHRRGRHDDAERAAREYLKLHPDGSYADQARSLLEPQK